MLNISDNRIKDHIKHKSILFKTLKTPNAGKVVARVLLIITGLFFILLFLPWQQNIRGNGRLTAFTPGQRPQSVETAIAGRIAEWHVQEGQYVQRGDTILTLAEVKAEYFDPQLLERTKQQIDAKSNSLDSKREKVRYLRNQITALRDGLTAKSKQAENKLIQSRFKLASDSVDFIAEQVRYSNDSSIYFRNKELYDLGNIPLTKIQDKLSKYQSARMKVVSAENKYLESQKWKQDSIFG